MRPGPASGLDGGGGAASFSDERMVPHGGNEVAVAAAVSESRSTEIQLPLRGQLMPSRLESELPVLQVVSLSRTQEGSVDDNGYERRAGALELDGRAEVDENEPLLPPSLEKSWSFLSSSSGEQLGSKEGEVVSDWRTKPSLGVFSIDSSPVEHVLEPGSVSLRHCVSMVISSVIGSGIFASPGLALQDAGSVGAVLCLWVLGAFLSACSCMISAELGTSFPDQLGDVRFLHEAFGEVASISYIWTVLTVLNGAGLSIQAMIFAKYLLPHSAVGDEVAAVTCVIFFTVVAISGVAFEEKIQIGIGGSRALLVGSMVAMAATSLWRDGSVASRNLVGQVFGGTDLKGLGLGLIDVMFAYQGFGMVVNLAPRMAKPDRDLPRALGFGMLSIMVAYLLLNLSYLCVLPAGDMASSLVVANDAAQRAFGQRASVAVGVLVAVSVAGNFQTVMRCGAEGLQGAAAVGKVPAWCGKGNKEPVAALVFQCVLAVVLILLPWSNISDLLKFSSFLMTFFDLMKAIAAIKLRTDRPFQTRRVVLQQIADHTDASRRTRKGAGGGGDWSGEGDDAMMGEKEKGESDWSGDVEDATGEKGQGELEELRQPFKIPCYPLEPVVMIILLTIILFTAGITQPKYAITSVLIVCTPYPVYRGLLWIGWVT
ncbi:hypothetical protein CBR_g627 [Chara braunii]|uniref:Amino acid transporter transmembrane domain-containing protein n=1 Tax=Chara braunii TaxID=69332 RepID=A0A388KBQ1_CHABU|nr:hypothetical protein CBR_g627 [Chara braunii]|eukprot:GBG67492.1 hypothetical protein CBR_g627 [Chara braunii]